MIRFTVVPMAEDDVKFKTCIPVEDPEGFFTSKEDAMIEAWYLNWMCLSDEWTVIFKDGYYQIEYCSLAPIKSKVVKVKGIPFKGSYNQVCKKVGELQTKLDLKEQAMEDKLFLSEK